MEEWMQNINTHLGNVRSFGTSAPALYKENVQVIQYAKTGTPLRQYTFNGMWPVEVSSIDLDWNTTDAIEEFTVTFQYDWWEVDGGTTGNAGGN
jgi:predicted urease superfamily metal-dependent hydrolase